MHFVHVDNVLMRTTLRVLYNMLQRRSYSHTIIYAYILVLLQFPANRVILKTVTQPDDGDEGSDIILLYICIAGTSREFRMS